MSSTRRDRSLGIQPIMRPITERPTFGQSIRLVHRCAPAAEGRSGDRRPILVSWRAVPRRAASGRLEQATDDSVSEGGAAPDFLVVLSRRFPGLVARVGVVLKPADARALAYRCVMASPVRKNPEAGHSPDSAGSILKKAEGTCAADFCTESFGHVRLPRPAHAWC
eukprot:scaffold2428_cov412-Prasinococcus_capsulatus_cf.AAC.21